MSKLSKFLGHPQEVEVLGESFMVTPLKVKDLKLFAGKENSTPEEQVELSKQMIKLSLPDEDITDEELNSMSADAYTELMKAINKVNGFADENVDKIAMARKMRGKN